MPHQPLQAGRFGAGIALAGGKGVPQAVGGEDPRRSRSLAQPAEAGLEGVAGVRRAPAIQEHQGRIRVGLDLPLQDFVGVRAEARSSTCS